MEGKRGAVSPGGAFGLLAIAGCINFALAAARRSGELPASIYYEETDFGRRARRPGFETRFVRESRVEQVSVASTRFKGSTRPRACYGYEWRAVKPLPDQDSPHRLGDFLRHSVLHRKRASGSELTGSEPSGSERRADRSIPSPERTRHAARRAAA